MVISWSGGTLHEYDAWLRSTGGISGSSQGGGGSFQQPSPSEFNSQYTYPHGSRYPLDELLEAHRLGSDGVATKWLLCFTWAMGLFTGLMPIEMQCARLASTTLPWWVGGVGGLVLGCFALLPSSCAHPEVEGSQPACPPSPWRTEEMAFDIVALIFAMAFNAMIISSCSSAMAAMDYVARHHKAKLDRVVSAQRDGTAAPEGPKGNDPTAYILTCATADDRRPDPAILPSATTCASTTCLWS